MARGTHDGKPKRGGLFDDLSISQVVAGALAAVTSMLLASQIGIYGSVIGVGVGSVVSAIASQLYKKFLQASADKLQELKPGETGFMGSASNAASVSPAEPQGRAEGNARAASSADDGLDVRDATRPIVPRADAAPTARSAAASTESPSSLGPARTERLEAGAPRPQSHIDDGLMNGDDALQRARARRTHTRRLQRGVAVVAVVSALLAVGVSALVVDFATTGQGVGAKPAPLIGASSNDRSSADDTAGSSSPSGQDASPNDAKQDDPSSDSTGSDGSSSGTGGDSEDQGSGSEGSADGSQGDTDGGDQSSGGSSGSSTDPQPNTGSGSESGSGTDTGASSGGSSGTGTGSGSGAHAHVGSGSGALGDSTAQAAIASAAAFFLPVR